MKAAQVSSLAIEEFRECMRELTELTSKPTFTKKDEARHSALLMNAAVLKKSIEPSDLRNFERDRLLRAAGLSRAPRTHLDDSIETEWRNFASGKLPERKNQPTDREIRAVMEGGTESISYTAGGAGGYFIPTGFYDRLFSALKQYDQIFDDDFSTVIETPTGGTIPYPIIDDLANASVLQGETTQSSQTVPVMGSAQLKAYTFRSQIVPISIELLEDIAFPIGAILERLFSIRHALGVGPYLVNGSGVSQPTGLVTAAIAGGASILAAAGSALNDGGSETSLNSIGSGDLVNCYKALNPAYRPFSAWAINDDTLQSIGGRLDKEGRPLVRITESLDGRLKLMGRPICICPSMPNMGSGHNSVVLYSTAHFVQRRVTNSTFVRRFSQLTGYVEAGLCGFESWLRTDSNLMSADSNYVPASIIQNHS